MADFQEFPKYVHPEGGQPTIVNSKEEEHEAKGLLFNIEADFIGLAKLARDELVELAHELKVLIDPIWGNDHIRSAIQQANVVPVAKEAPPAVEVATEPAPEAPATELTPEEKAPEDTPVQ
jgi:hypothetical protein